MAESSIPVDLFNPGQVFACLGLLELAEVRFQYAEAAFDWSDPSNVCFRLRAGGPGDDPVGFAISFLRRSRFETRTPSKVDRGGWKNTWGTAPTVVEPGRETFPFLPPKSPATLPIVLIDDDNRIEIAIAHWGDDFGSSGRDNVKFWGGAGGYPGAALARDALALISQLPDGFECDPFNASARQSSSFRFDWRRDYIPMDIGFSLNAHSKDRFVTVGYPVVEILAAIGLTYARPRRSPKSKLEYEYGVLSMPSRDSLLSPVLLRAALGNVPLPLERRAFRMHLDWPAKEGNERCITTVEEILIHKRIQSKP